MLSYYQMEKHFQLLQIIDQYRSRISQQTSLRALTYDAMPKGRYYSPDSVGDQVASVEKMTAKLRKLEALRDLQRPEVEETIKELTSGCKKNRIRIELIFTMHYLNGRTSEEIADILHTTGAKINTTIMNRFEQFEDWEV